VSADATGDGNGRGDGSTAPGRDRTDDRSERRGAGPERVEAAARNRTALLAELDLLAEENRRLRADGEHDRRRAFQRTALGAGLLGVLAAVGGVYLPGSSSVLFALAGVGLFTALLTYYLVPEQVLSASVGERVYAAYARTAEGVVADLGLHDAAVFLPVRGERADRSGSGVAPIRLFVPQRADFELPSDDEAGDTFVVTDDDRRRGLSVVPTGAALLAEFEEAADSQSLARLPVADYVGRVADALVDGFELVEFAGAEVDTAAGQVTVGVRQSALGPVDRFDHPVASFVAAALARRLDAPVTLETRATDGGRVDYYVTCRWETATETESGADSDSDSGRERESDAGFEFDSASASGDEDEEGALTVDAN
jgi:hypothetical protein